MIWVIVTALMLIAIVTFIVILITGNEKLSLLALIAMAIFLTLFWAEFTALILIALGISA